MPEFSLTWSHDGVEEPSGEEVQDSGNRKTRTLKLTEIDESDTGTYVCTAAISVADYRVVENRTSQVTYRGLSSVCVVTML